MVSQSARIEGVAFSAPQPEVLAPLLDALGAIAQPRQCLDSEATAQRFGLSVGRAEITPFLLGHERIELMHFPDTPPRHKLDPGPSNTIWFQHVAIVVRDLLKAAERLAPLVTPISAAPQFLPNGVGAWKFRNALRTCDGTAVFSGWEWAIPGGMNQARRYSKGLDHSAIASRGYGSEPAFLRWRAGIELAIRLLQPGS